MKRTTWSLTFTGWALVITVILAVWMLVTFAGCCPKPPACPKSIPPPPVVIVKTPPPCTLPALPDPLPPGFGVPDAQRDGYFVPRQSWALLGGYVSGLIEWVRAADGCLVAGRHAP
jgi:hypothetical protein